MNDGNGSSEPKNIAIDYDDTFTADRLLWRWFIEYAEASGHRCYIVTCRRDTEENRQEVYGDMKPNERSPYTGLQRHRHIFTGMAAKDWYCREKGILIDIWCDDDPRCVLSGK